MSARTVIRKLFEKGLRDVDNSMVIAGEGGLRGLNDNGKHKIKIKKRKKISQYLTGPHT